MVREDTLIRFIRIFSELSGQMRFSGSKRVLLEVAVIKLCRPQMETDELSLLERIRMLEKKLESGMIALRQAPAGQTAPRPDYGAGDEAFFGGLDLPGAGGNAGADELSFEEKAAPEDLQKSHVRHVAQHRGCRRTGRFKMTLHQCSAENTMQPGMITVCSWYFRISWGNGMPMTRRQTNSWRRIIVQQTRQRGGGQNGTSG